MYSMQSWYRKLSPLKEYNFINFSCLHFVIFSKTDLLFAQKKHMEERPILLHLSVEPFQKYNFLDAIQWFE